MLRHFDQPPAGQLGEPVGKCTRDACMFALNVHRLWLLEAVGPGARTCKHYLQAGKTYTVGREKADIVLAEKTVSRRDGSRLQGQLLRTAAINPH